MTDLDIRISKAKSTLLLDHPFFGSLVMNLPLHIEDATWFVSNEMSKTAAVSNHNIYLCCQFVERISDPELLFVIAHEVLHPALDHINRLSTRDALRWNCATDYVINQLLVQSEVGEMPEIALYNEELYQQGDGIADNIYNLLPDSPEDSGSGSGMGDTMIPEGDQTSPAEKAEQAQIWKVRVQQAAQAAKMMGKMSGGLERLVQQLVQPKIRWQDVLYNFLVRCRDDQRSFARPNRRFQFDDMILPSPDGTRLGELVFAMDCSGSISQEEIDQFAAELQYVQQELRINTLHVMYFDSSVSHYESYETNDPLDIRPHGGGGTAFYPVFEAIEERGLSPMACVFLTDLYSNRFGEEPPYPVLWATTGSTDAPFGEVIPF